MDNRLKRPILTSQNVYQGFPGAHLLTRLLTHSLTLLTHILENITQLTRTHPTT